MKFEVVNGKTDALGLKVALGFRFRASILPSKERGAPSSIFNVAGPGSRALQPTNTALDMPGR